MTRWLKTIRAVAAACVLLLAMGWSEHARSDYETEPRPPHDQDFMIALAVDRGALHPVYIFQNVEASYSGAGAMTYAGYCRSETDTSTGACPTQSTPSLPTPIRLRFTERRTGLVVELNAKGSRYERSDYGAYETYGLADNKFLGLLHTTARYTVSISRDELSRLPIGGIWDGTLALVLSKLDKPTTRDNPYPSVFWTAHIVLNVTEASQVQVYLPEFSDAPPLVDLDLRRGALTDRPGWTLAGRRVVDACLYDGYNAYSDRIELRVDDPRPSATDSTFLHVRHESPTGTDDERETIAYRMIAPDPSSGAPMTFIPGKTYVFPAASAAGLRWVRLPSQPFPVVCATWPITLETPAFDASGKRSGRYTGVLRVTFTPSTTSP